METRKEDLTRLQKSVIAITYMAEAAKKSADIDEIITEVGKYMGYIKPDEEAGGKGQSSVVTSER
jgi:hypothetical protein